MISYESNVSPFFKVNEQFCLSIENIFKSLNVECIGNCNSWGYEFTATCSFKTFTYFFKFHKSTNTRNGVIIPIDSVINEEFELKIHGLNSQHKLFIKPSKIRRWIMSKELKSLVPYPYYYSSNQSLNSNDISKWLDFFQKRNTDVLKMKDGELLIQINRVVLDPNKLMEEVEALVKFHI